MPAPLIRLTRPNGEVVAVPPDTAALLRGLGYKDEVPGAREVAAGNAANEEYYSGTAQTVYAGLEGAVSGLTGGIGAPDDVEAQQRAARHPWAHLGGFIAGAAIPALVTGGGSLEAEGEGAVGAVRGAFGATPAGLIARAGRGASELAGGGFKGAIAGGVTEGALFGAGGAVEHARLSDDPLTVESVLSGAGLGAAMGAGAGVLAEGVGAVAKMSRAGVEASDAAVAARTTGGRAEEAADQLRETVLPPEEFGKLRTALGDLRSAAEGRVAAAETQAMNATRGLADRDLGAELQAVKDAGNQVLSEAQVNSPKLLLKMRAEVRAAVRAVRLAEEAVSAGPSESAVRALTRARTRVADLEGILETGTDIPEVAPVLPRNRPAEVAAGAEHSAVLDALRKFPETPEEFYAMRASKAEVAFAALDKALRAAPDASGGLTEAGARLVASVDAGGFPAMMTNNLRAVAAENGVRVTATMTPADVINQLRAKAAGGGAESAKAAVTKFAEEASVRAGVTATGGPVGQLRAVWEATRRITVPSVKDAVRKAAGTGGFLRGIVRRGLHRAGGVAGSGVARRAGLGLVGGAMGYQIGGSAGAAALGGALGGFAGPGTVEEVQGLRAMAMNRIRVAVASYGPKAAGALRVVLPRAAGPLVSDVHGIQEKVGKEGADPQELFARRSAELRALGATAQDRAFALSGALGNAGHPEFGAAMGKTALTALGVVLTQMPRDPGTQPWGLGTLWKPSPVQLAVFGRVYEAVMAPVAAVERAMSGDVHPAAVEALSEAWPALYNAARTEVLRRLTEEPDLVSSVGRRGLADLGAFLRIPLTPLQRPEFIVAQAAMFATQPEAPAPSSGGQSGRPGLQPEAPTAAQALR